MKKELTKIQINKIIKQCGSPEDYCFERISGHSIASGIRNMREWVRCSYKALKPKIKKT